LSSILPERQHAGGQAYHYGVSLMQRLNVTSDRARCVARYHPKLKLTWDGD